MFEALLLATNLWTAEVPATSGRDDLLQLDAPVGLDTWLEPDVWSIPIYTASSDMPLHAVLYCASAWNKVALGDWKRSGNSPSVEREILAQSQDVFPFAGNVFSSTSATEWILPKNFNRRPQTTDPVRFHLTPEMLPAPGPDGHLAVLQPSGKVLEAYGAISLSSGDLVALSYSESTLQSDGDGYQNGQTASMIPVYLGVTDDAEIANDNIHHAMAITAPARFLSPQITYPAFAFDRNALTESPPYSGYLPMGSRLAIPRDILLSSLKLRTEEGAAIAKAAQKYGFIIVDRGGSGFTIRIRRNSDRPDPHLHHPNKDLQSDLDVIFAHLMQLRLN